MAKPRHTVTVVNPRPKKKAAKKKAAKKKATKKKSTKGTTAVPKKKRKKKRKNPQTRAPSRPRARNPKKKKKKRRARRNPTGGMLTINLRDDIKWALFRMGGKMVSAWAVRRFGDPEETQPSGVGSPTTGSRWTLKNLFIAWLAGAVSGEVVARFWNHEGGQQVYDGSVDMVVTKAWWSEIIHRIGGAGGAAMFGNAEMNALAAQGSNGDILDDGQGNRWLKQGGEWVAMMGPEEDSDELDEVLYGDDVAGVLERATPLDGELVAETPLDGLGRHQYDGYGHLMDPDSPPAAASTGQYNRRGSPDPFQAAYM